MSLLQFVDVLIPIGFFFSPVIAKYIIATWYNLNTLNTMLILQSLLLGFTLILIYGGVLGSDMGIPPLAIIYPILLMTYNTILYQRWHSVHKAVAVSLLTVFLLNATHEVNLFTHNFLYGNWIPANLLFGWLPMNPFVNLYTVIVGIWLFQIARLPATRGPLALIAIILLLPFLPFTGTLWEESTLHHLFISFAQSVIFGVLIVKWSRLNDYAQIHPL